MELGSNETSFLDPAQSSLCSVGHAQNLPFISQDWVNAGHLVTESLAPSMIQSNVTALYLRVLSVPHTMGEWKDWWTNKRPFRGHLCKYPLVTTLYCYSTFLKAGIPMCWTMALKRIIKYCPDEVERNLQGRKSIFRSIWKSKGRRWSWTWKGSQAPEREGTFRERSKCRVGDSAAENQRATGNPEDGEAQSAWLLWVMRQEGNTAAKRLGMASGLEECRKENWGPLEKPQK